MIAQQAPGAPGSTATWTSSAKTWWERQSVKDEYGLP